MPLRLSGTFLRQSFGSSLRFNSHRSMSSITSSALNADTLSSLSDFWLHGWKHGPLTEPMDTSFMQRWYQGSKEQDNTCKERYHEALIEAEQASHEHLLELATAKNDPYHAVGLLLLLDQISRNVYRGPEAKQAYNICDPKAQRLTRALISEPLNYDSRPELDNWFRRVWLYMPLMHSESLYDHDLFSERVQAWQNNPEVQKYPEELKAIGMTASFEAKHRKVIEEHGRYYSRNDALNRQCTPEEVEALKSGPGW